MGTKELLQSNGPGGYDIFVDPAALRVVSRYFRARVRAFADRQQSFVSGTAHRDGEFGRLPLSETDHVNQQYAQTQQDAVRALRDLAAWLDTISAALDTSAEVYEGADGR